MHYTIENGQVTGAFRRPQPFETTFIEQPRPSENHIWNGSEWVLDTQSAWNEVRQQRNRLLTDSDWTQVADAPVDKQAWATYRQALRDITTQTDPLDIEWPEVPSD